MRLARVLALLILCAPSPGVPEALAQAPDVVLGTWEPVDAKSTYSPGPPPKNRAEAYEAAAFLPYVLGLDGKERSISGFPAFDTVAATRLDAFTIRTVVRKGGRSVIVKSVISRDGKTITVTSKGLNQKGEPVNNRVIYERARR